LALRWVRASLDSNGGEVSLMLLSVVLVFAFACSILTSLIGIFAIFGAFMAGAVLSGMERLASGIQARMRHFVTAFFLPIFFAFTGTRTRIGSLAGMDMVVMALMVLGCAVAGKFIGCGLAARFSGFSWREAGCIGVLMNTRALMELIVINVGKDLGVVPDELFTMLVIMALATTVMTTPGILWLSRGTEFEAPLRSTGWITSR
jgi:Kef-type K+ transport system membrane component KefB